MFWKNKKPKIKDRVQERALMFEAMDAPERTGYVIIDMIKKLKRDPKPLEAFKRTERYLLDDDYDVEITVRLISKKSKYELGMEMFNR